MIVRLLLLISIFFLFVGPVHADELRYYLLTTDGRTTADLSTLETDNKRDAFKDNMLSAVYNNDRTQVMIKVPHADSALRTFIAANFIVVRVWTKADHAALLTLLYTDPNWSVIRETSVSNNS